MTIKPSQVTTQQDSTFQFEADESAIISCLNDTNSKSANYQFGDVNATNLILSDKSLVSIQELDSQNDLDEDDMHRMMLDSRMKEFLMQKYISDYHGESDGLLQESINISENQPQILQNIFQGDNEKAPVQKAPQRVFYNFFGKKLPKITIDFVEDYFPGGDKSKDFDDSEGDGDVMHESIESFYDNYGPDAENALLNAVMQDGIDAWAS